MIAFAIAMTINYPSLGRAEGPHQRARGINILSVVGLIFAAGVFTGILSRTRMMRRDEPTASFTSSATLLGPYLAVVTAVERPFYLLHLQRRLLLRSAAVLREGGATYGAHRSEMGRASVVGQPAASAQPLLVPSTYLLVGLVGGDLPDTQRLQPIASGASQRVMACS